jgi:hypothetical protein
MTAEVRYLTGSLMSGVDVRLSTAFSAAPALSIGGGIRYHALSAAELADLRDRLVALTESISSSRTPEGRHP